MTPHAAFTVLGRSAADLALGSSCAGCGMSPGLLCPGCRALLHGPAHVVSEVPGVPGLGLAGAADYGDVRASVIGHKDRGRLPLARPLGGALAVSVTALLASTVACPHGDDHALMLVPMPSVRANTRQRGHDPMARTARSAARVLRRSGRTTRAVTALRHVRKVRDQAGLSAKERKENLSGALEVRRSAAHLLGRPCVILVDDIVTTGATLRAAATALTTASMAPCGAAVVAVAG